MSHLKCWKMSSSLKNYKSYLSHIVEEADYLIRKSASIDYHNFVDDENLRRIFVRALK